MTSEAYTRAYTSLNTAQKEAVDTIEGPVMVIAGPGTGKTQILTLRIANILLSTDTQPENILALTFTEAGARAMRERLLQYVGAAAYRVGLYTFHGFAETLIRAYPDAYARSIGGRPASDIEKVELLESILADGDITLLRPLGDPTYYVSHILRTIALMKQEYITPDRLSHIIDTQENELRQIPKMHEKGTHKGKIRSEYQKKEKTVAKNKELLLVYRKYRALLQENRLYDFDDMILETTEALDQNKDMLRDLQETYHYILADEHQDVNGSQNKILELLSSYHESPNLFVVGDEKQAIYRFQGASLENFLYFENVYPLTKTISLTENYRSGQKILDIAHKLVAVDTGPAKELRKPLVSQIKGAVQVEKRSFSHQAIEDDYIADAVAGCISGGVSPQEIAIIFRTNREVEVCASMLRKRGIPAAATADGDILNHPITLSIRNLIDAVVQPENESVLFATLHGSYWGIPANDLVRIMSARSYTQSLISIISSKETLKNLRVTQVDAVYAIGDILEKARRREVTEAPHRVLEYVLNESGFLRNVMSTDPLEGGRVVRRLFDEIEELVARKEAQSLKAVSENFNRRITHNLQLNAPYIQTNMQSVQVMTAHKSKGLEFTHVFIPHLHDALWGGRRHTKYFDIPLTHHLDAAALDPLDDERRLLFVALTRAKKGLYISHAETNAEGKDLVPSRLLVEVGTMFEKITTANKESSFDPLASLASAQAETPINSDFLKMVLLERGLSATSLNNYLRSPWDYFYRNVIRIPEIQPLPMLFGTALHNTLQSVTAFHTAEATMPSTSEMQKYLERELYRMPITTHEWTQLHERGLTALLLYMEHLKRELPKVTKEELKLRVILETGDPELPEIPLTGMLDRLDFNEEGVVTRVIDYKSGRPKTRNNIEGKTKNSNGDYKRQLIFYALLLSLYDDERYQCREGVLSFIEADSKGKIHEESFTITDAEVFALKEEITHIAREIVSGSFLMQPCDPMMSSYCDLARLLMQK